MDQPGHHTSEEQEADEALRDARARFIAGFSQRHTAMRLLLASVVSGGNAALAPLRQAAHKMAGLAGVVGFPTVSEHASALEVSLDGAPDTDAANAALARISAGFTHDIGGAAPSWAADAAHDTAGARILIAEDDHEQRRIAASGLRAAGFRVVTAESGTEAVEVARAERPDLILLDVDLPGLDGMAVCRQLKLNPSLSSMPIIFCSARGNLLDRVAGFALGADDYVTKPYSPDELLIRIRRLLTKPAAPTPTPGESLLPYESFAASASALLAGGSAAVVMVRVAHADFDRMAERLSNELRRRDVLGRFSDTHIVVMMPGLSASAARAAVVHAIEEVEPRLGRADIGAADGRPTLDDLISNADLALAQDRVAKSGDTGKTTVLLADDDPDVLHIIDTRVRAAGYRTLLALDGQLTLATIEKDAPALVLLDLMMPKLTGFDVLQRLRARGGPRPKTIVVSARGREDDVTRAFELGADDYVTKPFNPDELVARIARLTR